MISNHIVIGHHGCDESLANDLVLGNTDLRLSDWDWLGSGIYFWEANYGRTFQWAEEEAGNLESPIKTPVVVGVAINLGTCLNLTQSRGLNEVKKAHERYLDTVRGFFMEGEPLYEGAGLRNRDHLQICVRNPGAILGYFLPNQTKKHNA